MTTVVLLIAMFVLVLKLMRILLLRLSMKANKSFLKNLILLCYEGLHAIVIITPSTAVVEQMVVLLV